MSRPRTRRIFQKDMEEASDVDFTEKREGWNVYDLEDGTTLKIKLILKGVRRLKKWNPDGSPIYMINSTNIVRAVNIPKKLRAKPKVCTFQPV